MKRGVGSWILYGSTSLLVLAYVIFPFAALLRESVSSFDASGSHQGYTLANLLAVFSNSDSRAALWNSTWVSLVSTLGAGLIGIPLAFLFTRYRFAGSRWLALAAYVPLTLPPIIGIFAFWLLIGDVGLIPKQLGSWWNDGRPLGVIKGIGAVMLVHAYSFSVYFYAMTSAALQRLDPTLAEAARTLGADRSYTLRKVILPTLSPALVGASALSFMLSMASFSAPYLLANGTPFLSVMIYEVSFAEGIGNPDFGLAAALSVVGAIICGMFLVLSRRFSRAGSAGRGARATEPVHLRGARSYTGTAIAGSAAVLLLLPQVVIALISVSEWGQWTDGLLPPGYTTEHYAELASDRSLHASLGNSLWWSAHALLWSLALALAAAWLVTRTTLPGRRWLHLACVAPLALPGTVVAFALLRAFNVPLPQTFGAILAHTVWLLPLAWCVRCLPLAIEGAIAGLSTADPSHEEAARTLGAGPLRSFVQILMPHLAPALIATAMVVYVTCLGEFVAAFMVYQPTNRPIGVYIYQSMQSGIARGAAASTILVVLMFVVLGIQALVSRRHRVAA